MPDDDSNAHPAVMFEIMAKDQPAMKQFYGAVFGWHFTAGQQGFDYVKFPAGAAPLLGGIGQAQDGVPGMEPGHAFYLLVRDVDVAIDVAVHAGGARHMPPAEADGYRFAMVLDPEGNPIGLVEPFGQ